MGNIYLGNNSATVQGTKFRPPLKQSGPQPALVPSGVFRPAAQTAAATGAGLPSPLTWLLGALLLLWGLKILSEHPKTALNPAHIHVGGYNVLTIFTIVIISVVGVKILVNRPFFSRGPQAGFASLVNAT
jgi:hypothetical protein